MKRFFGHFICFILSSSVWAIDGAWNYSADPYAKNKTGYYADHQNIHFEAEFFDYNQDLASQKEALGYFRSDLWVDFANDSSLEVETLGDRSKAVHTDVDNITTYVRHLTPLTSVASSKISLLSQLILPMNRVALEDEESPKPVLGVNIDFFRTDRLSMYLSLAMSNSSDLEFQQWKKTYITNLYLSWMITERISTVVDLYFEREQGAQVYGYKWIIASLNYDIDDELKLNLGTRTVGDETAATNTLFGATLIF